MQIVWLPLFAARVLGNVIVTVINGALGFLPLSETKRRQWSISIRRNWSWLRREISYRAFEHAVYIVFERGMAWVFRKCRHLTPNTALLVILGAVLWLPISFGTATVRRPRNDLRWIGSIVSRNGAIEETSLCRRCSEPSRDGDSLACGLSKFNRSVQSGFFIRPVETALGGLRR